MLYFIVFSLLYLILIAKNKKIELKNVFCQNIQKIEYEFI